MTATDEHRAGEGLQMFLAGWLMGSLLQPDAPMDLHVEAHAIGDRFLPSFEVVMGQTRVVVHVDLAIDQPPIRQ